MTRVYLVQHASAFDKSVNENRPLTPEGEKEICQIVEFLGKKNLEISKIYHSPKLRAVQTAKLIADILPLQITLEETEDLKAMSDPTIIGNRLNSLNDDSLFVGHLPHLERLSSYLVNGNKDGKVINFHNAGIVCLNHDNNWSVEWIVIPELLKEEEVDSGLYA